MLAAALAPTAGRIGHSCAGVVLNNVAAIMAVSGRLSEAEHFARQAIEVLKENYAPDSPVFLRPLQILASAWFEHGQLGRAREEFQKMQALRLESPRDKALLDGFGASLLSAEGRYQDAEAEYLASLRGWEQAGRGDAADAGAVLNALGALYLREHRLEEALTALDRAQDIFNSARDAVPADRFKLLATRAVIYSRRQQWHEAERDLRDAVSIADDLPGLDPALLAPALDDYAYVLRKNHRRPEARSIEARAAALHKQSPANTVVDVTELLGHSRRDKK